tara:strand:- start:808 stop:1569 length:762 start_codon:yes stop_codon:yes gene_type:complete
LESSKKEYLKKSFFKKDLWLSEVLNRNVFSLSHFSDNHKNLMIKSFSELCDNYLSHNLFIFTKVKTDLIKNIHTLEDLGFKLIDTNILFKRDGQLNFEEELKDNIEIRFAEKSHKIYLGEIAYSNFNFSRFHVDPLIKRKHADNLKKNWVENFFLDKRGDYMVVALYDNMPIAFLQLILKEKNLIIDLIAVSSNYRGQKIGSALIKFASENINKEKMLVGTQISNIPSIKLYQKLGFNHIESDYVFHFHNICR